jgi:hypothetical protein
MRGPALAFVALGVLSAGCGSSAPPPVAGPGAIGVAGTAFTDFSFAHGSPVGGVRLTACGRVTIATTNTERAGATAFGVDHAHPAEPATVTFQFDRPVAAFDLTVGGLRAGDMLGDFNVGNPPRLSGNLIQTADGHVTTGAQAANTGSGTLSWPELDTREIKLGARGGATAAFSFERFRATCRTTPAPLAWHSFDDPELKQRRP